MAQTNISLEKAIAAIKACSFPNCSKCYLDGLGFGFTCIDRLMTDVLALLKEQQSVKPLIAYDMYFCGSCKYAIPRTANYCPKCGKKVEWGA